MRDQDSNEATIFIHIDVWMWTNIYRTTNKTESRRANASARSLFQHGAFALRWKLPHLTVQNERINWIFSRHSICMQNLVTFQVFEQPLTQTHSFPHDSLPTKSLLLCRIKSWFQPNQKTNNFKSIELCTTSETMVFLESPIERANQLTAVVIQYSMVCIISL